jgi:site-specific DNA-methyltransferase (adenine-specific)
MVPIEKDEAGNTLDGHHRIKILEALRAEGYKVADPPTIIRPGLTRLEKRAHARALNLSRRHLTRAQRRTLVADQLKETPWQSDRHIATILGTSPTTVGAVRARLVAAGQLSKMDRRVGRDGRTRRRPAIIAKTEPEYQRALRVLSRTPVEAFPIKLVDVKRAERIAREHMPTAMPLAAAKISRDVDIRHGDFQTVLADVPDHSIDLILTDPPYGARHLEQWRRLGDFAKRVLRPGGFLVAYSGQMHLPTTMTALAEDLEYLWTIAVIGKGPKTLIHAAKVHSAWKPVLVFAKSPRRRRNWILDIIHGDGPDKCLDKWQQNQAEAELLIKSFSSPGDWVVDPFLGSGTVAVAAHIAGRRFIGCDSDKRAVQIAANRLCLAR